MAGSWWACQADIKDSRRLVEFVLECDGEAFTAGRDKRCVVVEGARPSPSDSKMASGSAEDDDGGGWVSGVTRDRLDARLRYHMSSGVQIYMARESRTTGVRGRLMGIYACTVIDYLPIPRLPMADEGGPFPSTCNQAARRFISDVKVRERAARGEQSSLAQLEAVVRL